MTTTADTRRSLLMLAGIAGCCGLLWLALPDIARLMGRPTYGLPDGLEQMLAHEIPRADAQAIADDCLQANPADRMALLLCVSWRSDSWRIRYDPDWIRVRQGPARP